LITYCNNNVKIGFHLKIAYLIVIKILKDFYLLLPEPLFNSNLYQCLTKLYNSMSNERLFNCYIGVDYSGAQTPTSSLKALRIYMAEGNNLPVEISPLTGTKKYWTRQGIAEWLLLQLTKDNATLVGIDHGFSMPLRYFERYHLLPDWSLFLEDFKAHWPTDEEHMYVDFIRDDLHGQGAERYGDSRWRRLCEQRCGAKSVFHFDIPGSVAKSTHAGIPWLLFIRQQLTKPVHFWPFDGWTVKGGQSVVVEAYPSLWKKQFAIDNRTNDQHDAYSIAAWMQQTDRANLLAPYFQPSLLPHEQAMAQVEGWIFGVN